MVLVAGGPTDLTRAVQGLGRIGLDVNRLIIVAFAIASAFAGLAGVLWAAQSGIVEPHMGFTPLLNKGFPVGNLTYFLEAGVPILPIAVDGTYAVYPAGARWITPGPVAVRVGTPIPTAGLTVRDKDRLLEESRTQIEAMLSAGQPAPDAR